MSVKMGTATARTATETMARATAIRQELARRYLLSFTTFTKPDYLVGWVHQDICERLDRFLEQVRLKQSPRLMLFMPPRHGKTELVSRRLPAFAFGRNPDIKIIATSYGADLARLNNRDVQRVIDDNKYAELFPDTRLFGKNIRTLGDDHWLRNSDIFEIVDKKGAYKCAGVGGAITGMGGDILIVDDPVKDDEEAWSVTYRERAWRWYTSTAYTRVEAGGGVLLCMTRWNEDDLAGRLIKAQDEGGDKWEVIVYPAVAETDEPHRLIGEALDEQRWPLEKLLKIKGATGSYNWASLFQQRPAPTEGGIIKRDWWKYYQLAPERFDEIILSWDCAFKDLKSSDFVVGQVWGQLGADLYLLDQVRGKMSFTATATALKSQAAKWPKARAKLVEDKANGTAVIDTLQHSVPGLIAVEPEGGKVSRAQAVTPYIEAGNVHLPDPSIAPWIGDFVEECAAFPNGAHDDQCFVAGTPVATIFGDKPIENISVGDLVITPFGVRRVLAAGKTGEAATITRGPLTGTAKHKVFYQGKFVAMDTLTQASVCDKLSMGGMLKWAYKRLLFLMESNTDSWAGRGCITLVSQQQMADEGIPRDFMSRFMNIIAAKKFCLGTWFITKTAILTITTLAIWSVYRGASTASSISSRIRRSKESILREFVTRRHSGMGRQRALLGIKNMGRKCFRDGPLKRINVFNAERTLLLAARQEPNIAPTHVGTNIERPTATTLSKKDVSSAAQSSKPSSPSIPKGLPKLVADHAQGAWDTSVSAVYNITVEKDHVFYAHGLLVSNCDAMSQALNRLTKPKARAGIWVPD